MEGLLADDPVMAESYNVYQTSLPFAISRLLSPRTVRGRRELRSSFLKGNTSQAPLGGFEKPPKRFTEDVFEGIWV